LIKIAFTTKSWERLLARAPITLIPTMENTLVSHLNPIYIIINDEKAPVRLKIKVTDIKLPTRSEVAITLEITKRNTSPGLRRVKAKRVMALESPILIQGRGLGTILSIIDSIIAILARKAILYTLLCPLDSLMELEIINFFLFSSKFIFLHLK